VAGYGNTSLSDARCVLWWCGLVKGRQWSLIGDRVMRRDPEVSVVVGRWESEDENGATRWQPDET